MINKVTSIQPTTDPREAERKKQLEQKQTGQPQPVTPVKSNLPPVTYQQQAGAISDPRFSQALAQKLQKDVGAKQAALQQQQTQFQQQLQQAGTGIAGAQSRIGEILNRVQAGTATDAELAEYQKLQQAQYQGPAGLEGVANIAALSQLAASPRLLAQQYAGFAPGGVAPGAFERSIATLQRAPELAAAREAATGLAQEAMTAEEVAAQQAALLKGQTEAAREAAETGSKAAMAEVTGQISEQTKAEREAKDAALKKLKEGLFLTGQVKDSDIRALGLDPNDPNVANVLESMQGLDLSRIGKLRFNLRPGGASFESEYSNISVDELDKKVQRIRDNKAAGNPVTPEEEKLLTFYNQIGGLARGIDEEATKGALSFAKKEDLTKINALRRLRGEAPLTEADIGKKIGGVSKERLAELTGLMKQDAEYSDTITIAKGLQGERTFNHQEAKKEYDNLNRLDSVVRGAKNISDLISSLKEVSKTAKSSGGTEAEKYINFYIDSLFSSMKDKTPKEQLDYIKRVNEKQVQQKRLDVLRPYLSERSNILRKVKRIKD